ncbi:hypothetical protein [Deinococcus sp. QL22]|uniref:hypothetical protein n=1 Tax=Deinococcus sp. QL22 TaxID=2939437 RepID=UPI0020176E72|nr:hypothetical protein [Deinococcus sp. QL22]UQN08024.1 hypothetical protein M1R55_18190 [Deinococcus sp. QL22]
MQTIFFMFRSEIPRERQKDVLHQVQAWSKIRSADWFSPNSTDQDIRRSAYVVVDASTDTSALTNQLKSLPEVESAFIPSERGWY